MSLKPYPNTKPSGIAWLGDIPSHWQPKRADGVVFEQRNTVDPASVEAMEVFHYSIPVMEETGDGRIEETVDIKSSKLLLSGGELLVSKLNPRKSRIFIALPQFIPIFCSTEFVVLKPFACEINFLYYVYSSEEVRQFLSGSVESATKSHQRVGPEVIAKLWIAIPPLPEQQAIAAYLDRKTAEIDAVVREKEEQIRLLTEQRQAVISHAVTRGLDPNAPLKPSGIAWLGDIPEHWGVKKLKFFCLKIGSGKTPKGGSEIYSDNGIVFLRSQNVYNDGLRLDDVVFISPEIDEEMAQTRVFPNDVLLNITGASIGRTCIVPIDFPAANVNQHVCILRLRQNINPHYFAYCLKSHIVRMQINSLENGSSREGLNFEQIGNLSVPAPFRIDQQQAIVKYLDIETARLDGIMQTLALQIGELRDYRQALISAVVTGKVDVRG